jgi:hypothetical protein
MNMTATHLTVHVLALSIYLEVIAHAQNPRPPQFQSPVVHPDRTVTFDLRAPSPKKAVLVTEGGHTWMNARHYLATRYGCISNKLTPL